MVLHKVGNTLYRMEMHVDSFPRVALLVFIILNTEKKLFCSSSEFVEFRHFENRRLCDADWRLDTACYVTIPNARSLLECVHRCGDDQNCVGASVDKTNVCYKHFHCSSQTGCAGSVEIGDVFYKSMTCANGGEYSPDQNSCRCFDTWVGRLCQNIPRHCGELIEYGYGEGVYWTSLQLGEDRNDTTLVVCYVNPVTEEENVTILLHEGSVDFNLTWRTYKTGFVINNSNFWLGFDTWHDLSVAGYSVVYLEFDFGELGGLYRKYREFYLGNETDNYAYTFQGSHAFTYGAMVNTSNVMGSCFGWSRTHSFSTWDRDNDQDENENCAAIVGSGFWFGDNCALRCNFMAWGPDHPPGVSSYGLVNSPLLDMETLLGNLTFVRMYLAKK